MDKYTLSKMVTNTGMAAGSGGMIAAPTFNISSGEVILYVFGFMIAVIAFAHNEYHVNKSDTVWKAITKGARYVAVGIFAYPSAYAYAGHAIWDYSAFKGLAGVVVTLVAVALLDAWLIGKENKLKDGK